MTSSVPATTNTRNPKRVLQRLYRRLRKADRSTMVSATVVTYVLAASVAWAMITPIGGVPDEPAHITYSAAVVRGDLGAFEVVDHPVYSQLAVVTVPQWVASITNPPRSIEDFPYPCYSGGETVTADCAPRLSTSMTPSRVPTTVTRYPPAYHWIVGLPTLVLGGEPAVYAMRIVSATLAAAMVAMGLMIASPSRRTWLAMGTMIAATPMVTHLAGSVNPSGLEIAAALGLGIGLMGIAGSEERRPGLSVALTTALAFAVAWARPNTHLTLVAVIGASILINSTGLYRWVRQRMVGIAVALGVTAAGGSALVFKTLGTRMTEAVVAPSPPVDSVLLGPILDLQSNLHEIENRFIHWGTDLIGRFGWLDHSPPELVVIAWGGLALTLVVLAVRFGRKRDRFGLLTVSFGALILAPLFVISKVLNAFVYQARYHLPLAVLISIGAIVILSQLPDGRKRDTSWSILRVGALVAPVAMLISVAASLHRYSIGGEAQLIDVLRLPLGTYAWLPPPGALLIAVVGAGTAGATMYALSRLTNKTA